MSHVYYFHGMACSGASTGTVSAGGTARHGGPDREHPQPPAAAGHFIFVGGTQLQQFQRHHGQPRPGPLSRGGRTGKRLIPTGYILA